MKQLTILFLLLLLSGNCVFAQKPKEIISLSDSNSWSMVILPDPQSYIKDNRYQPIFELMLQWIKSNKERLNTELVLCTGDLVEQNNQPVPTGKNGNQTSEQQWNAVSRAFGILDDAVPYILCTGNHDYGVARAENRYSQLNSFFPVTRKSKYNELLQGMLPNASGVQTLENAYYEYTAPTGQKYLILSLEFTPRKAIVKQARELMESGKYKEHRIIYLTHSYLDSNGKRLGKEGYKVEDVTPGQKLWKELIYPTPNSSMVICGHYVGEISHRGHVGFSTENNCAGKPVHQMMFNAQAEGGGWNGNGGDGWIRILEFLPDNKTVLVKTFSPLFAVSPTTQDNALRTEEYDQFSFSLE